MPGHLLHRIARRICPADTDRVLEPLIADLQREWQDAPTWLRRRLQLARGYAGFWRTVTWCVGRSLIHGTVAPLDREMIGPALRAFGSGLLGVTVLRTVGRTAWHETPMTFVLGEAQAWSWAAVFAMVPALMFARGSANRRWSATTTRLLIAGLAIAVSCIGWIGPVLFRASLVNSWDQAGNPYVQTLPALLRHTGTSAADALLWQRALHARFAFSADAGLLGLIGWQLGGIARPTPGRAALSWFALMELVLICGAYINGAVRLQWAGTLALVAIVIGLRLFGPARRDRAALPDLPA